MNIIKLGYQSFQFPDDWDTKQIRSFVAAAAELRHLDSTNHKGEDGEWHEMLYLKNSHTIEVLEKSWIADNYEEAKRELRECFGSAKDEN